MTSYFLDTSACVSYFHEELGSDRVKSIFADSEPSRFISRLGAVELASAISTKFRSGEIDDTAIVNTRNRLYSEISTDSLFVLRVLPRHYKLAEELLVKHAPHMRLRAANAIQLAIALDILRSRGDGIFVCADRALIQVAAHEGLACSDPQQP